MRRYLGVGAKSVTCGEPGVGSRCKFVGLGKAGALVTDQERYKLASYKYIAEYLY